MTNSSEKPVRQMPRGGRKGGTSFPRIPLEDCLKYSKKLVAKTHTGPQPRDVIFAGVVGAKSGTGEVRISALKQYGLLKGDTKENYSATDLAKKIEGAPLDEVQILLRTSALKPAVFKKIFDTFHGDEVTKAKLRQRVIDLNVHPEQADNCVNLYLSSFLRAGLVTTEGDKVLHIASRDIDSHPAIDTADTSIEKEDCSDGEEVHEEKTESTELSNNHQTEPSAMDTSSDVRTGDIRQTPARAIFNVNVNLDSSLDIEKLQKQLELLKRFGAI